MRKFILEYGVRFDGYLAGDVSWSRMRTIDALEFKAQCLALLDEITTTREPIAILKRGRPVAQLMPLFPDEGYAQDGLRGSVKEWQDIEPPVLPASAWEAASDAVRGR